MARKNPKKSLRAEARKPIAKKEVANKTGTFEIYGVPSVAGQKAFRVPVAVIRSDAEVAKSAPRGREISTLLGEIMSDPDLPPHGTGDLTVSLARNRAIQSRMIAKMEAAAEVAWPGYGAMFNLLQEREIEFIRALGELGVGVA